MSNIKSVAIIGAGPSGAGTLKAMVKEGHYTKLVAFERRPNFGGLWNYTTETDLETTPVPCEEPTLEVQPIHKKDTGKYVWAAPVYNYLDTNVPKDIMTYAGKPFPEDTPVFPHRSQVLQYMVDYSQELIPYVRFNTKVVNVELTDDQKWRVTSRLVVAETNGSAVASELPEFADTVEIFDAVVIASGNYDVPYIPNRPGMSEWNKKYPGSIFHVKAYRQPEDYADITEKIVVVGNSASGGDLAYQLATGLKRKIYKSKRSENLLPSGKSDLIVDVPDIVNFDAETKTLELKDGSKLEGVGIVIFATGYLKSFPFLDQLNKTDKPLLTDGHRLHGIYEHILLYNYPNLAIIGIARYVLPTRAAETQGCWLSKIWSGKVALPSIEEMKKWEIEEAERRGGNGKTFHDLLFPHDVHYSNRLNNQILDSVKEGENPGLIPKLWDKEQTAIRGSLKGIKEAYIQYKEMTGIAVTSYKELVDAKVIDQIMISDEKLKEHGFNF
ncbi:flavin-containing monooxygenase [Suhomyces tanzawaensis NRRL Y-17324]|uniref:Flavin-containing monooxygenase n=1 Tax=Suhomyces tanzawaensis NRRL Y-17324 TaxID=984487 RepID=A0A1E4SBV6_9ASCO|nr:flavin-containing monooxygenase [Suhomyces tanzawaensis NRRL Y-17324]ODV76946.1 flavin-containing monooxygenase [Suhomyces tanzawaensis NRRL Y-17324]